MNWLTVLKLKNISCEFYINYRKIQLIFIFFVNYQNFTFVKVRKFTESFINFR
jgi:hypothetical protein